MTKPHSESEIRLQFTPATNINRRTVETSTEPVIRAERARDRLKAPVLKSLNGRLLILLHDDTFFVEAEYIHRKPPKGMVPRVILGEGRLRCLSDLPVAVPNDIRHFLDGTVRIDH